jgi:hypothetical protein
MPDFRAATDGELKALRALKAVQRQVRRVDVRLAANGARVRVARAMKAVRGMRRLTDLRWHAQITAREADALNFMARAAKARRVFVKWLVQATERLK